jgi:hypothetical protein
MNWKILVRKLWRPNPVTLLESACKGRGKSSVISFSVSKEIRAKHLKIQVYSFTHALAYSVKEFYFS